MSIPQKIEWSPDTCIKDLNPENDKSHHYSLYDTVLENMAQECTCTLKIRIQ